MPAMCDDPWRFLQEEEEEEGDVGEGVEEEVLEEEPEEVEEAEMLDEGAGVDADSLSMPVDITVAYNALGRKFAEEPAKIALNLSRDGAARAIFVAVGHICWFQDLEPDLVFEVVTVKPWCAYIELKTVDGSAHNFTTQELRSGGSLRVRVGACPLEECAATVLRFQKARPRAGLKLGTLLENMSTEWGINVEIPNGELPPWLEQSSILTTGFSELREDWLVKSSGVQTPLERTIGVIVAPEKRRGTERRQSVLIDELYEKLGDISSQLVGPPLIDIMMMRRWLEASPYFELNGDDVMICTPEPSEETPPVVQGPATPAAPPVALTPTPIPAPPPEPDPKPTLNITDMTPRTEHMDSRDAAPRAGNARDRRYGRAMKVLDELSRLNQDALKLSRDKRRIADECIDGAEGDEDGQMGTTAGQLLEVLNSAPEVAQRLEDEVKAAMRDGALEAGRVRTWQGMISAHRQRIQDLMHLLELPEEQDAGEIVQQLTHNRHAFRDFQRDVLDEVTVALSGANNSVRGSRPHGMQGDTPRDGRGLRDVRDMRDGSDPRDPHRKLRDAHDGRGLRDVRDIRDGRDGRDGRDMHDMRDNGRGWVSDSRSRSSSPPPSDAGEIQLNAPDLYEVKSSEGAWYPATIRRLKRSGRYECDLFGGGCSVLYPNVKPREIRLRRRRGGRSHDRNDRDSRSCDGRAGGRGHSGGHFGGKGPRKGRR